MDAEFWHQRWENNEIGFHRSDANPLLINHLPSLNLAPGNRLFLPLCGKTLDIGWLLSQGYRVVGAELSPLAISQLFEQLGVKPTTKAIGTLTHFQAPGLDIFGGDFFQLTAEILGQVDAIYDRAALVALPPEMRGAYTRHLRTVTETKPQLLITYEYDQTQAKGPPHSVPADEVHDHYQSSYQIRQLLRDEIAGGLRGKTAAWEAVWYLSPL